MTEISRRTVVVTRTFVGSTLIDGGDTVAIEFETDEGSTAFVLLPSEQALDLGPQIMVEAAKAAKPEGVSLSAGPTRSTSRPR